MIERAGIYVASRASLPERGEMWRQLRASGVNVTASWIDEDGPKMSRDLGDFWVRIVAEIARSERLILYVEPEDFPLKGAFIEVGMALANDIPVFVVSPGVRIDYRTCRPLGSWILHPRVALVETLAHALP